MNPSRLLIACISSHSTLKFTRLKTGCGLRSKNHSRSGLNRSWIKRGINGLIQKVLSPSMLLSSLIGSQSGTIRERAYASRVFPLPKTHLIKHSAATSEDHLDFHIWALSFFVGMRLTATEAGFLDATPLKPHSLVDFVLLGSSLTRAVELAEDFWMTPRR